MSQPPAPTWASLLLTTLGPARIRTLVDDELGPAGARQLARGRSDTAVAAQAAALLTAHSSPRAVAAALRRMAPDQLVTIDATLAGGLLAPADRLGTVKPTLPASAAFLGRAALLAQLGGALQPGARLLLHGPPGSGRQALAAALARAAQDRLAVVWWVDAATEASTDRGLRALATAIGLAGPPPGSWAGLRGELGRWLAAVPDWLVVFAGAPAPERLLALLPTGQGCAVATAAGPAPGWAATALGPLAPPEAAALLQRLAGPRTDPRRAADLARRLGGWPGALRLAGARARALAKTGENDPLQTILTNMGPVPAAPEDGGAAEARAAALRRVRPALSPEAGALGRLLGAVAAAPLPLAVMDARVDPALLPPALGALLKSDWVRQDAARELVRAGLADWRPTAVGPALRWQGPPQPDAALLDHLAMMLQALAAADALPTPLLDVLLPHVDLAANHAELSTATRRWLATWVGRRLDQLHEHAAAVAWLQRALAAVGPDDPPGTLEGLLNDLALAWRHAGQPARARTALQSALAGDRQHGDPLAVAATQMNLANVCMDLGLPLDASEAYTEVCRLRSAHLGPRHPLTAHAHMALARLLAELGDVDEARKRFRLARGAYAEARGPHRADLVRALRAQAQIEAAIGDHALAIDLGSRALRLLEELRGPTHPETLAARAELVEWDEDAAPPPAP